MTSCAGVWPRRSTAITPRSTPTTAIGSHQRPGFPTCIPTFTPEEAVDELEYAVGELGLKAVMLAGVVPRRLPGLEEHRAARWIDAIGHDSLYDYDPVWAACERLGVAPTFHASGQGWGTRMSTTNYAYNH